MNEMVNLISQGGLPLVVCAMFLLIVWLSFRELKPSIDLVKKQIDVIYVTSTSITKLLEEVRKSNENVAHALEINGKISENLIKVIEEVHKENEETQGRLYLHDDRAEKIFTVARVNQLINQQILTNQLDRKQAETIIGEIKNEVEQDMNAKKTG